MLDDKVDKYNDAYHRTIKMKSTDVKSTTYFDFDFENNDKNPKSNIGEHIRNKNIKISLLQVTLQIGQKEFL